MFKLILASLIALNAHASNHVRIAAASDLKFALDEMKTEFVKTHKEADIEVVLGSSGQFEQQIEKGAPFDLFLSADESYPKMLTEKKLTQGTPWTYGTGTLVLWTSKSIDVKKGLQILKDANVKKIAIANPEHAPYGKAAKEALGKAGLYEAVQSKLVLGDSISQTAQFAQTGAADVGLIALALARSPQMKGKYEIVKEATPLTQAGVVLTKNETAKQFADFVISPEGQKILRNFGFKGE